MADGDNDVLFVPDRPTEHVKEILNCSRVQQYLHYIMQKHKCTVEVGLGMCTEIKNGMIGSQLSEHEVNNFSPLFCTVHNESDRMTDAKILRLEETARNGKISQEDMEMITNQTVTYTKDYNELKHMMWNFYVLVMNMFGEKEIVTMAVKAV